MNKEIIKALIMAKHFCEENCCSLCPNMIDTALDLLKKEMEQNSTQNDMNENTITNKQNMMPLEASIHSWFAKYSKIDISIPMALDLRQRLNILC